MPGDFTFADPMRAILDYIAELEPEQTLALFNRLALDLSGVSWGRVVAYAVKLPNGSVKHVYLQDKTRSSFAKVWQERQRDKAAENIQITVSPRLL